ncbi:translation initiation factor IF-2 [Helicobacter sp. 16-1353]|uniref:translation initiation factor IF-2 n=1 Tax=Helicobacter sp. 16-1353 TaxID=2004996 RepID=UPI000DCD17A5|nr:translation initiation factor IF-2 [Helicobacter sp. 16-1353]RAX55131.1 translation initiation factor IF-2 [Helicobacter sp. 16-1353]
MAKEQLPKVKVTQIATELGMKAKDVILKAQEIDIVIKSVNSSVEQNQAEVIYNYIAQGIIPKKPTAPKPKAEKAESKKSDAKKSETKKSESKKSEVKKSEAKSKKSETKKSEVKKPKVTKQKEEVLEQVEIKTPEVRKIIIVSKNNIQDTPKENDLKKIEEAKEAKDNILHSTSINEPINESKIKIKKEKDKKKDRKAQEKRNEQKIEKIDINRNLGETSIDYDDEIILFDLSEMGKAEEEKEEKIITDRVRIQRANPWFVDNIGRDRKKSRSKTYRKRDNQINHTNTTSQENSKNILIPDEIRVYEFADKVNLRVTDIISKLFNMGEMVTKNDFLDATLIEILAQEFNLSIEISKATQELEYLEINKNVKDEFITRAPVVTIMGHVDHGKTSLLDYIRESRISKTEQGGITQHIGAYMVNRNGKDIAFIDTPGHEAFANMRSRGAQVTDIAIIVIAADDGVKQQTKEALAHAKDSNVQIIIAMNKMDKEGANPDKLKAEMAEIGYNPADWGGEYDFVPVSAKTGQGIDDLLDTILLQAEIMELKANIASQPKAVVLEGSLDKGKGPIVTVIVQEGKLKVGNSVVADTAYGKVRALIKDDGSKVDELNPSQIALLVGLNEVPSAGAILVGVDDDAIAKEYATKRKSYLRAKELSKSTKVSFDELSSVVAQGKLKPLLLILKADTQGSLEAVKSSLEALSNDEVKVNIISSSVGNITENDIAIAVSSKGYILGFNVKPLGILKAKAKEQNISIKSYSVIYNLIDDVKEIIATMMSPIVEEEIVGNLEVRDIFSVGKGNIIAGCFVNDGFIERGAKVRLLRGNKLIHTGNISSLKRFKDDVKEVTKGYECGIMLDSFNDIKVSDNIEVIKEVYKQQKI